ncbi:MAG: toxic anion resistance protein [Ruminococcus sp.]|nr:toxic anion resistance protein [Ruminococcus sp.]
MGLDFSKFAEQQNAAAQPAPVAERDVIDIEEYNIVTDRENLTTALVGSEEVDTLVSTIEVHNMDTIVTFGAEVAEEISKASDTVLNSLNIQEIDETNQLMVHLAAIMSKFDIDELKEDKGLFDKLFGNVRQQLDKILAKYHTMGDDVDKIYVQLRSYDQEIRQSNHKLNTMFEANVGYYHELVKYILAGEQACQELQAYIDKRTRDMAQTGDNSIQFEIQSLNQSLMMMEQRVHDLRTAENVAMQSIPMLKTMEFSNYNLLRKINTAFIITLPIFKQALAQAILLKRQKIQAESMRVLDEKTNELLLKNAHNTVEQSKLTSQMASGSSIQIETLEQTWRTIMDGIEETRQIELTNRQKRVEDRKRLEAIKQEFNQKFTMPDKK